MIKVGTIKQIHEQLVSEGYKVSEYCLRIWVKQGVLPAVRIGVKSLISYRKVLEILEPQDDDAPPVALAE